MLTQTMQLRCGPREGILLNILPGYGSLPGYGILPYVTISVRRMPKDQTSDLMLNVPKLIASGAVHLMGNFAPGQMKESKRREKLY